MASDQIFQTIGIISRPRRSNVTAVVPPLLRWLEDRGIRILYDEETASALPDSANAFPRQAIADE